jgi:tRNA A-37 threonylcarbamoyl transferase component Bud32
MFQENVGSSSLFRRLTRREPNIRENVKKAAHQLKKFHNAAFSHGDIHCGNVIFSDDGGDPKLIDLSTAIYFGDAVDPKCSEFDLIVILNGIDDIDSTLAELFLKSYGIKNRKLEEFAKTESEIDEYRSQYKRIQKQYGMMSQSVNK